MSDTIQTARWSLGGRSESPEHMYLSAGRESTSEAIEQAVRRAGLAAELRAAFPETDPRWFGFWINSPLTRQQAHLLHRLFLSVIEVVPRYQRDLQAFIKALARSAETGEPLHVELTPPGHMDFGWHTTFVHCPRCKAEGPVERWEQIYPVDPVECEVCGYRYSPAATHSSERDYFAQHVTCAKCGASHRVKDFSEDDVRILEEQHYYRESVEELDWLRRVEKFYERHPERGRDVKPHFMRFLESSDPKVRADLFAGVPFEQIELPRPDAELGIPSDWTQEDREVADYLRHNHFSLPHRMQGVIETIARLKPVMENESVACPSCGARL